MAVGFRQCVLCFLLRFYNCKAFCPPATKRKFSNVGNKTFKVNNEVFEMYDEIAQFRTVHHLKLQKKKFQ